MSIATFVANLKFAIRNRQKVDVGGGLFKPEELEPVAKALDAHEDLTDALLRSLPFLEDMRDDPMYKAGYVDEQIKRVRDALKKAGALPA